MPNDSADRRGERRRGRDLPIPSGLSPTRRFERDDEAVDHRFRGGRHAILAAAGLLRPTLLARDPAGCHHARPPRNRGLRYPPDPPTVEEIVAVMRAAGEDREGIRLRGLIVVLRAGLRISEALALAESNLDRDRASILCAEARAVAVARWGWTAGRFNSSIPGVGSAASCPSGPCSGLCEGRPAGGRAARPRSESNCATAPPEPGCVVGLRLISCAMPTRWRCRVRASRWSSSSGSWGMPISG